MSSPQKNEKCPYLKDPDCGRPNKDPLGFCEDFHKCMSYRLLKAIDEYEEEKKDGKQDA